MRAWLNLRRVESVRGSLFTRGLKRLGYQVVVGTTCSPAAGDVLVTWNRIGVGDSAARAFEREGRPVIVAENATWGNEWAGDSWLTLARGFHNTAGCFPVFGPERFDSLGFELQPWREDGETVVLAQRGIGPAETAMPRGWQHQQKGRLRPHPGRNGNAKPLADDLKRAARVVTWGSGAAVLALSWGVKVESHMPRWVGEQDNTDEGRLAMFRRLAWAQARLAEIEDGSAFARLLEFSP